MKDNEDESRNRAMCNALSNFGFEMELIEDQKYQIINLLKQTGRENIDKVVEWMEQHGFFESFASITHHNAWYGGLAAHSFDVYEEAVKLNAEREKPLPEDSVMLCSLLHDLCKAGLYYYDKEARVTKKRPEIAAQGHGIRSLKILESCGLPLSREEALAIWWHMGEHEEPFNQPEIYESTKNIPLCNLIRRADHLAAEKKVHPIGVLHR
jgi:23S rRNA maturation-related 3'-5' exoribonuclease YhaM